MILKTKENHFRLIFNGSVQFILFLSPLGTCGGGKVASDLNFIRTGVDMSAWGRRGVELMGPISIRVLWVRSVASHVRPVATVLLLHLQG